MPVAGPGTVFKRISALAITAGTPATVWTPAAGKKVRLMGYSLSSSAASSLFFLDNVTATGIATPLIPVGGSADSPDLVGGYLSTAADAALKLDATVTTTVSGTVYGVEE